MVNQIFVLLGVALGGGTVGIGVTAYFNHKGKQEETRLSKDEKAFAVLEGRLDRLQEEVNLLKAELEVKENLVDELKDENLRLKYENIDLQEKVKELRGE